MAEIEKDEIKIFNVRDIFISLTTRLKNFSPGKVHSLTVIRLNLSNKKNKTAE